MSDKSEEQGGLGDEVLNSLDEMASNTPAMRRAEKEEAIRLALTDALRKVRKMACLTQAEAAEQLGVSQSWISKLESANYDHQVESVVRYLDAMGADLHMSIQTKTGVLVPVQYKRLLDDDQRYSQRQQPTPEMDQTS